MESTAILFEEPGRIALSSVALAAPGEADVTVAVEVSGISTGTERLLFTGEMPAFPGMGYPLVPGYEAVGRIVEAGPASGRRAGERVFVPGSAGFADVRGLFGASASRLVVPARRAYAVDEALGADATLIALAATAYHAVAAFKGEAPELVVGHGVLGRLAARIATALGHPAPTVWEANADRRTGGDYSVIAPEDDDRRDYARILDVSGDSNVLDTLIGRIARGGEIVLAGFYKDRLGFSFPPAFMREARLAVAAEWQEADLLAVRDLVDTGGLSLANLVTGTMPAADASNAYRTAFEDPRCLKMLIDWSEHA
ncbi:chlorophyll synthesis pathway protein BchC [Pararhizobium mangrovi]|uniref:Chlorophyll synthesis pathway protein BchC n=1 Tax=Pararhizobium mangrovi TaxID=2590452 RepID=A0A506U5E9_9HYPH|nr:chlorophyll synthesis pathway protein BchC [Pararhizobium mangrovi]TPW29602.1 chlorophyll synthesis pathway protein BchC [Pararhizobium mangrovi]